MATSNISTFLLLLIIFIQAIVCAVVSIKKAIERKKLINLYVAIICSSYLLSILILIIITILGLYFGFTIADKEVLYLKAVIDILMAVEIINYMNFTLELFYSESKNRKKNEYLFIAGNLLYIIVYFFELFTKEHVFYSIFINLLLSWIVFGLLSKESYRLRKRLRNNQDKLNANAISYIFYNGIIFFISFTTTAITMMLVFSGNLSEDNPLNAITIIIGSVGILFLYLGFFRPKWFFKRKLSE